MIYAAADVEAVLEAAKVRAYREGENLGRWKGNLVHLLPARAKIQMPVHHAAVP